MNLQLLTLVVGAYALVIAWLGWLGYRHTRSAADFLVGGREIHPVLMALAYGSTFISTSAIVGFAGVAASMGLGLLWLTSLNVLVGVFVAFVVFGRPTRRLGAQLDAHTFPELLGRRFGSRLIQGIAGGIIAVLMPLYAAAVLIGGARFLEVQLRIDFQVALFVFAVVTVGYVLFGGLKGVVYTDAFQATLMMAGIAVLLAVTYAKTGGLGAHQALTDMADRVPETLRAVGHRGWTAMPGLGTPLWWQMVSTIILGVGIGVLAQPQLTVRFMTVKSGRELNRALVPGGLFMVLIPGGAYLVGALSNVYFAGQTGKTALELVADPATGRPNVDKIMPLFVADAMPDWFAYLFMLALLAAAMSTLSAQFHAIGTAIGRDLYEQALSGGRDTRRTLPLARAGVLVGFALTVLVAFRLGPGIIAIATALFFGACAAAFLPAFVAALFWPRATRAGALAGMVTGVVAWGLWVLLVHERESAALGLARALSGNGSLLAGTSWAVVDPIVVALPLSALVTVVVSLAGRPDAPAPVRTA